jgi:nitroimidazol reductase NimA-like FMN-containing flavoprotein (pyridoxamine 5'-phosphate oxidase superfamily)
MTGTLDLDAIDALLTGETIAHLACIRPDGRPYVVPITYAYDGKALYSYSADGDKLEALRANPSACVVVDRADDAANWVSVIVWGTFHELADEDAAQALRLISTRLRTVAVAETTSPSAERSYVARIGRDGVLYCITIAERTGRYSTSGA